jgi:negative regulator of replication initiation
MVTIEIDEDIFNYLKSIAEPFVDTPNAVLRRLIFPNSNSVQGIPSTWHSTAPSSIKDPSTAVQTFMAAFLQKRYGETFRARSPYRTMFESDSRLIYFQNFSKAETMNLWYRLTEGALKTLKKSDKAVYVCFTNPVANIIYEIPMTDISNQLIKVKWTKKFLEVNIDPANSRWRELDWNIEKYQIKNNA